ncbi:DNA topoisomerase 1 [Clostridia bacterium]|nr:DNA topoisomerase 1 [Clostridia bacterium]
MAKNLVIVESPAKVKTIKKFLGNNYQVMASNGHVRDLPKSRLGIDIEHEYEPKYITIRGKGEILANLRKEVKKAEKVYLATDPDREGEAISWHLSKALKLDEYEDKKVSRISFNEITQNAVKASLKEARNIDMDLVDAQQARRIMDRMVGYSISPLLWAKVKRGLSAGRVQSVALRLICDREEEINAFIPEEYWTLEANLEVRGTKKPLLTKYTGDIPNEEALKVILKDIEKKTFFVEDLKIGERTKKAPIPFITSTLQQEASKVLNFSTQKTMRIAQQLYEGIEIEGNGIIGLITYIRTDSTRISDEAVKAANEFISSEYGEQYVTTKKNEQKSNGKIQDAHEAIRPSNITLTPTLIKESLSRDLFRLYQLIWRRFVASQMKPAIYDTIGTKLKVDKHFFSASASQVRFDGFLSVYQEGEQKKESTQILSYLQKGMELNALSLDFAQHFTQAPPHYTEASLVKALEEEGIGRPSTYAPTITTILARRYITKENKNLYVTELGEVVNHIMTQAFPTIVDVTFTANLETLLDQVGEGKIHWKTIISNFYPDLNEAVKKAEEELETVKIEDEVSEEICEFCGKNMVIKYGPHGKFLACPGFPECKNTKPYFEKIGIPCPLCGEEIVLKKTKKGRKYFGCEKNPECEFMSWQKPAKDSCPQCGKYMTEKGNQYVCSDQSCGYREAIPKEEKQE